MKFIYLIILFLALTFSHSAQTPSPAPKTEAEITRLQLVDALERAQIEVLASRKFVDALKSEIETKTALVAALRQKDALAQAAIQSQSAEIAIMKGALRAATLALDARRAERDALKKDLDRTRRKLGRARSLTKYLAAAAAALAAVVILK